MTPAGAMMDEFGERCHPHSFHRLSVTGILSLAITSVVTVILIDFLSSLSSDITPLTEVWEAARSGRTDKTFCCCCSCSDSYYSPPCSFKARSCSWLSLTDASSVIMELCTRLTRPCKVCAITPSLRGGCESEVTSANTSGQRHRGQLPNKPKGLLGLWLSLATNITRLRYAENIFRIALLAISGNIDEG